MKLSLLALSALFANGYALSMSGLPSCGATCVTNTLNAQFTCSNSDTSCICGNANIASDLDYCLGSTCSSADVSTSINWFVDLCSQPSALTGGSTKTAATGSSATDSNIIDSPSSISSTSSTSSSSQNSSSGSGLSLAAKAGIAAGIVLLLLLIGAAVIIIWLISRKKKSRNTVVEQQPSTNKFSQPPFVTNEKINQQYNVQKYNQLNQGMYGTSAPTQQPPAYSQNTVSGSGPGYIQQPPQRYNNQGPNAVYNQFPNSAPSYSQAPAPVSPMSTYATPVQNQNTGPPLPHPEIQELGGGGPPMLQAYQRPHLPNIYEAPAHQAPSQGNIYEAPTTRY